MGVADLLAGKVRGIKAAQVILDPTLRAAYDRAAVEVSRAEAADRHADRALAEPDEAPAARDRLAEIADDLRAQTAVFTFAALPRIMRAELVDDHGLDPNKRQAFLDDGLKPPLFDVETYGPALLHLSCVAVQTLAEYEAAPFDPSAEEFPGWPKWGDVLPLATSAEIFAEWSDGEVAALYRAADSIQGEVRGVPFTDAGFARTRRSEENSSIAPLGASPTANTSGG